MTDGAVEKIKRKKKVREIVRERERERERERGSGAAVRQMRGCARGWIG